MQDELSKHCLKQGYPNDKNCDSDGAARVGAGFGFDQELGGGKGKD